jgi:hypothetical protein
MHNDDTFVAQTNIIIENLTHAIQQALESKPDETTVRSLINQEIKQLTRTYDVKISKLEEEIKQINATLSQPRTATKPTSTKSRTIVPAQPSIQQQNEPVTTHKSPHVDCTEIKTIRMSPSYESVKSDKTESILSYFNDRLIKKTNSTDRYIDTIALLICLIKQSNEFKSKDDLIINLFLSTSPHKNNHEIKAFVDGFNFSYVDSTNNGMAFDRLLSDSQIGKVNHKDIQLGDLKKKYAKFR